MNRLFRFEIEVKLRGPVLTKSTSPSTFGLDAAVARDFDGTPILPGTLIEGRICEALFILEEDPQRLTELFGAGTDGNPTNEPQRGELVLGDLIAGRKTEDDEEEVATISRVKIDAETGTAAGEMLRVIEAPFAPGEEVTFKGKARMFCKDEADAKAVATLLQTGLLWQVQVGSLRTTGFGRLLSASVQAHEDEADPIQITGSPAALDLTITPLDLLCISQPKIGGNLFESEDVIPGNMLAGAVKQTADKLGIAIPGFDDIRFRHAFPSRNGTRAIPIPLSTVKVGKTPRDVSGFRDPVLLHDGDGKPVAPTFPIDWKEHGDVLEKLGWAFPARELRVRTAIDSEKRTARRQSDENAGGALFAWEMVHPFDEDENRIAWRTRIDLGEVTDKKGVVEALAKVLPYLSFVSKTKARCKVEATACDAPESLPADHDFGKQFALLLRTPALLIDPRFQDGAKAKSGALSARETFDLYAAFWKEVSGGALELSHHFASQSVAGGNYLAKRFQGKLGGNKPYDPYLLTDAGSVFVFRVKDPDTARTKVNEWLKSGLPLPGWAKQRFGETWEKNPFIPNNGFGEVSLHQPEFPAPKTQLITLADPILPKMP